MPFLESFNPAVVTTLSHTAEIIGADEELLESLATDAFQRMFTVANSRAVASVAALLAASRAMRLRLLRKGVAAVKGDLRRISYRHVAAIEELLSSPRPGAGLSLPCGVKVKRIYEEIVFTTAEILPIPAGYQLEISSAGVYELPCGATLQVQTLQSSVAAGTADTLVLDAKTVALPLTLRYFREGDRFIPLGMSGSKKLKDLFVDRKIPLERRRRTPLLLENDVIIWVCGVQASSRAVAGAGNGRAQSLVISFSS
jgi:tRNA(Ile)-lysidine synthase